MTSPIRVKGVAGLQSHRLISRRRFLAMSTTTVEANALSANKPVSGNHPHPAQRAYPKGPLRNWRPFPFSLLKAGIFDSYPYVCHSSQLKIQQNATYQRRTAQMELSTKILAPYVGGQLEIQNESESYIFRGEIESITVEDDKLQVRFSWLGKYEKASPTMWTKSTELDYEVSLLITQASDIGPSFPNSGTRIMLNLPITNEVAVFYPPDGSKLDRSRIEGL